MPVELIPGGTEDENGPRRFTVAEYHTLIRAGILDEDDKIELLEGYLVPQLPRGVAHDSGIMTLGARLQRLVPDEFALSPRCALTLADSEPEPDFTVIRSDRMWDRHPGPDETVLVIEVAASSLAHDRENKGRIYARAGIPVYWVVNVIDKQIEVFTQPSGPAAAPGYARRDVFPVGADVPVVLDGAAVGTVAVAEVVG